MQDYADCYRCGEPGHWVNSCPTLQPAVSEKEHMSRIALYIDRWVEGKMTLEQKRVDEIAASMLENGQQMPILLRPDGARFVLVEGLHRLEAAKALGERTIVGYRVDARKH